MSQRSYQYDFADSRRLQGDDARVERNIQRMGLAGPSSVLPTRSRGGDGQVTVAEKRASVKGQQQRGTLGSGGASGGQKDRCKRGKACGATCIDPREDCIIDFDVALNSELNRMVNYIKEKAAKAGNPIEAGSEREKQVKENVKLLGQHLTGQSASGGRVFNTRGVTESQLLTLGEVLDLKGQRNSLGKADIDEVVKEAFRKDVSSRGARLNREDLALLYDSLPKGARDQLNRSGGPGEGKWYAVDKDGNPTTKGSGPSRERGLAVLDQYMRQGGTDAYSRTGRVFSPTEFDVEHIKPVSKGGLDHPDNWVLARAGAQRKRREDPLGKFIDSLPNNREEYKAYIDKELKKKAAKNAANNIFKQMDPKSMTAEQLVKLPKAGFKYVFRGDGGTFFTNAFFPVKGGGTRTSAGPPVPLAHAAALLKTFYPPETFSSFGSELKRAWNKEWGLQGGSTQNMVSSLQSIAQKYLTPQHFALIQPELTTWANKFLQEYPNGRPQ